jgi:NTP pyrophosphatase (non-canonical NTP hydrolase)
MSIRSRHSDLVSELLKDPQDIVNEITARDANLIHGIMGVAGEVGELLDTIKKHVIYKKELDYENVVEELGDIEFYLEVIRQEMGIERDETLESNIIKLRKRYPSGYSNQLAQERLDKNEETRMQLDKVLDYK